ncbi:MAG: chromate transporter [Blastocatellia bacterium]|jgi:chromate transporter|nr:chromate transporter [Blastocatellia bacterium]
MSLWRLTLLIALFNLMTFGNGPVMIPLLQTHLVDGARVLTEDQLLYAFTIARVTPGQANFYVASIGYMLYGMPGAIVATLAIILPAYVMIPLLHGYEHLRDSRWIEGFTKGLTVTSVGLILAAVVQIARGALTRPIAWVVLLATLVMTQLLKWNIVVALVVASCLGLLLKWLV